MKWPWLRFPFTSVALALAYVVLAGALLGDIHLIELPAGFIARIQQAEIDAIVLVLLLLGVAFLVDQAVFTRRINQMARLHVERLRGVQVTIGAVQDIVSNGLNQLELLRLDAHGHVPEECLALFDEAIAETVTNLTVLKDVQAHAEQQMFVGTGNAERSAFSS